MTVSLAMNATATSVRQLALNDESSSVAGILLFSLSLQARQGMIPETLTSTT